MESPEDTMSEHAPASLSDKVRASAEEAVAGTSAFVVDVVVRGRIGARVVEVFLDSDAGLGIDELAQFSREIGLLLEAGDVIDGRYRLDVSTPGLERPLVPRQFARNVGRTLRVVTAADEASTVVQGTLAEVGPDRILVKDGTGTDHEVSFSSIQEAKIVLPW